MGKILVPVLIATLAVAIASRDAPSPGGSSWQGSSAFGGGLPSVGVARSSISGWAGSGSGLGRSVGNGASTGWSGATAPFRPKRSGSGHVNENERPFYNGWAKNGHGSSGRHGGKPVRSYAGWSGSFAGSIAGWPGSMDSTNGWDDGLGSRSNNAWQSSEW